MANLLYVINPQTPLTTYSRSCLSGQLRYFSERGYEVGLATAPDDSLAAFGVNEGAKVYPIPLVRELSPRADSQALLELVRLMRRVRPDIVNAGTPKAGLLGMLAARISGVPSRIYTLHGLPVETAEKAMWLALHAAETLAASCSTRINCVSRSLQSRYVELGYASQAKTTVLGHGSANGVPRDATDQPELSRAERTALRAELGIDPADVVVGYVGRLSKSKGTEDLQRAFDRLRVRVPRATLLLVGDHEAIDGTSPAVRKRLATDPNVRITGVVANPNPYYQIMDAFAFPSYREGLPTVLLEAAMARLPIVAYQATGTVDIVRNNETGLLVPVGDVDGLTRNLETVLRDRPLATRHGASVRAFVSDVFSTQRVWGALDSLYQGELR